MPDKMRILHMTPPIVNNGVYKYIFSNWEYMDHDRFEFSFLMQAPEELKKTKEWCRYRFDIRSFSIPQRVDPQKFRREIYDILSDGYDAIHLHTSYWRGFMIEEIAMEIGIPRVIVHSHSSFVDQNNTDERNKQLSVHEELKARFTEEYATDFWACSKLAADWLYGPQISREKIKIFPNAVDAKAFRYNAPVRNRLRDEYSLADKLVIGNTGRFEYQKNQGFLIDAFKKVCEYRKDAVLVLIGEGLKEDELRRKVHEYGLDEHVLFTGWQKNVSEWLQAFDIFCLPSLFEGFPISLIEAQTSGLKCIVSDTVTDESRLTDNVVYERLDAERWAQRIMECSDGYERFDRSDEVRRAGYDLNSAAKKLERYYEGDFS